jgi:uncharacterized SAM-binding protein YcdF (DUF218 family)
MLSFVIVFFIIPLWGTREYINLILSPPRVNSNATADCGVVLTGGFGRVREGVALLSKKQVDRLIISGVHQHSTLADMMPEIIYYPEINLDHVILERRSNSTASNAQQSLILTEALSCKSILLITSDYHMHRALQTFEKVFPSTMTIHPYPVLSDRLYGTKLWSTAFEEFYKYIFYSIFVF